MLRLAIDIANLQSGLLADNIVRNVEEFQRFENPNLGIPILIHADAGKLYFKEHEVFEIDRSKLCQQVFATHNENYIGQRLAFPKNRFIGNFRLKQDFSEEVSRIVEQNIHVKNHVMRLRDKYSSVGSFQTRNIPHFGHEKIIELMLDHCDHVVINPVVGSKKPGDINLEKLAFVFNNILSKKFSGRISFQPVIANMYYAGPREAIHHAIMRRNLGFTHFSVGRDHAGAEGIYADDEAPRLVRQHSKSLGISVITHDGAYFCKGCQEVVLKNKCSHKSPLLQSVSGSEFRMHIENGTVYNLADLEIQNYISNIKDGVFEK